MKKRLLVLLPILLLGLMVTLLLSKDDTLMIKKSDSLSAYRSKRDFSKTTEPSGRAITSRLKNSKKPIFVIQKHAASHLHYDFRLRIGNVLVSWAVPKGPSMNPKIKRLAVQTEDHPLDYAFFEGVIAEGYGAGTVMVWDIGTYKNIKDDAMEHCLKDGRIEIELKGKKLNGAYALIRTAYGKNDDKKNWLFFKIKDDFADARKNPVSSQQRSALTDRTMQQIKRATD